MRRKTPLFFTAALTLACLLAGGGDKAQAGKKAALELATVCLDELCGYINSRGEWHIPPQFAAADPFSKEGLAWITINQGSIKATGIAGDGSVASNGPLVKSAVYTDKSSRILPAHSPMPIARPKKTATPYDGRLGLINAKGEFVVQPTIYWEGRPFSADGLAVVRTDENDKWGLINTRGQWAVKPEFDAVSSISNKGLTAAKTGDRWGYINPEGQWAIEADFDDALPFSDNGLAIVKIADKWGCINAKGRWAIGAKFDSIGIFFASGQAVASLNGRYGLIDLVGQWIIKPEFHSLSFFDKGLGIAQRNDRFGLIKINGQWVIEPKYSALYFLPKMAHLAQAYLEVPWRSGEIMGFFIDINSAVYRTGLSKEVKEPGFHWELTAGVRTLFNRQGKKILTVERICGSEVAKNRVGDRIWPLNSQTEICAGPAANGI